MSSPAEAKQMEPEGKPTSQVRLKWERHPEWEGNLSVHTHSGALLVVDKFREGDPSEKAWLGSLSVGGYASKTFDTQEDAQLWCEAKLTELLQKDLKSLGSDVQAEPAEVNPAPDSDIDPVISLSLEGEGSTLKLQVDGETQCSGVFQGGGVYREWLWLMFWLPNYADDEECEPWVRLTFEEVKQLRDHLNQLLSPAEVTP